MDLSWAILCFPHFIWMNYSYRHLISPFLSELPSHFETVYPTQIKTKKYKKGHLMILKSIKLMVPNIFQPFLPNLLNKSWCPYIPLSTDFPRLRFACVFQHHLVASVPPIMGSFGYLKKRLIQFETELLNPGSCTSIDQHLPWGSLCILSSSFRFMGIHLPF